jgi:hypothetical protein
MKIAVMQPYLFPYVRYFQLIDAVDVFVFFDDVQYLRRGWINRNRVLSKQTKAGWQYLTFPVVKTNISRTLINEVKLSSSKEALKDYFLKSLPILYGKIVSDHAVTKIILETLDAHYPSLSNYLVATIKALAHFLGLKTKFLCSSELSGDKSLKGQSRIIEICKSLNATEYCNLPGGKDLYVSQEFVENNIELTFIDSQVSQEDSYSILDLIYSEKVGFNDFSNYRDYTCIA